MFAIDRFANLSTNKKILETELKSDVDEATDFYNKEIPNVGISNNTCLAVINLDSTLKKGEDYYPQVLLKECKYIEKEEQMKNR